LTQTTEAKYIFSGKKTPFNFYDELSFLSVSLEKALATCQELYPDFDIESYRIEYYT